MPPCGKTRNCGRDFLCPKNKSHFLLSLLNVVPVFSQMSDLLMVFPEKKPPPRDISHINPRNIISTLSTLNQTERGTGLRSGSVLPENIRQLSSCQFKRKDYLRETFPASVPSPIPAERSSHEGQLTACPFCKSKEKVKDPV